MSDEFDFLDLPQNVTVSVATAGIMDWLEIEIERQGGPLEHMAVGYIRESLKPALAGEGLLELEQRLQQLLGGQPLTLKALVDAIFVYIESKETQPWVRYATQWINTVIDEVALPILAAYLATRGIILPVR